MMTWLLRLGQTGALDGLLLAGAASQGTFYATDYTTPLLFLADGTYLEDAARAQHLGGDQWGMTNETGSWPGQAWLWLYTFWYQIKPFLHLGQCRCPGVGPDGRPLSCLRVRALHPGAALAAASRWRAPPHLAPALP